jgi:hypothetical protein
VRAGRREIGAAIGREAIDFAVKAISRYFLGIEILSISTSALLAT